ncbi:MAG: BatA and WFA domain-containing protein [Planctomycetaceae bacterium]|nr:BatA and WFA domain-containing protein [Planctomycetaceae bacterium]
MTWPEFTFPFGAWFFLSLIPLIILYFLKLKRPRLEIPSLALWQSVVNDQRVNSPFQKFRRNLLLLLQLILLCLVVLALTQPFISAGPETADFLPVLIDCSASMSSRVKGADETRLDLAKKQVRAMIENLRGQGKIALFEFSTGGRRLTEFTEDQQILLKALDQVRPTHRAGQLDEVLRMADAFTRTSPVERVVVITDGNLRERVDFELPFKLDVQRIDSGDENLGITEMNARRSGADRWDVFVRVAGSKDESGYGELTLTKNGLAIGRETVEASAENSERVVFSVDGTEAALLQASLTTTGFDSLETDNNVWLTLPKTRPLKVRASPELYSWQHGFHVQSNVEVDSAAEPVLPEYDLIVSDSVDLQETSAPIVVYVGQIPPELQDLISLDEAGAGPVEIVDWVSTAPLLRHVHLRDVQIAERTRLAAGADTQELEKRGFEVLIHGAEGPLMLQRRLGLETEYWFLFHTDRSTLPYRIAFPILVSNALETAMQRASLSEVAAAPTGVLPPLNVEADRDYSVSGPSGERRTVHSSANGVLLGITADEVGRYDVTDGDELVTSIGTGLLSPLETSLQSVEELQFSELKVSTQETELIQADRHLWWSLALLAFVFLLVEWWYFQRMKTGVPA